MTSSNKSALLSSDPVSVNRALRAVILARSPEGLFTVRSGEIIEAVFVVT